MEEKSENTIPILKKWWFWVITAIFFIWILSVFSGGGGMAGHMLRNIRGESLIIILAGLLLYFLPSYVAWRNKKRTFNSIFIINLFLGWTFLGWVIALAWAASPDKE